MSNVGSYRLRSIVFDNLHGKTIIAIIWFSSALQYLSDKRLYKRDIHKCMTEENSYRSSHILSPHVERYVFLLVTYDKKFHGLFITSKFIPRNFYLKQNFENPRNFISSKIIRPTVFV